MRSEQYGIKLLLFYMAEYRHAGQSNVTTLLRSLDTAYGEERI